MTEPETTPPVDAEKGEPAAAENDEPATTSEAAAAEQPPDGQPDAVKAEPIAREFHDTYERLAPDHGYKTREASAVAWDQVPQANRSLMIATVADLLGRGVIATGGQDRLVGQAQADAGSAAQTPTFDEQAKVPGSTAWLLRKYPSLLRSSATPSMQADAAKRVYRTCTMDFALGAEDRIAVDRALAIADELGPKTDAAQVNAIAERLRADGFADKVTTDGRLIVTGYAARTGSQLYGDGKSTWYEYRSEDEVEKSLKSFDFATFTDDHPPVLVTADNWREYARGMLGTDAELLPPDEQGLRFVKVKICVGDISTIRKMRDGKVQLSTGYTTIAVRKPGVDAQGIRYLYCQTDIQVNHESLVDEARAGPKARVLFDGAFVFEASKEDDMTTKSKTDQMDPEAAMALLDAIKAYAYAESPEAADGAIQAIATALALDPEMVKQALGGGEMMEMDGVKLRVSADAATRIRAAQTKVHGDASKLKTDLAAAQGELAGLARTVAKLEADKASADMRELEREIAPFCPQLTTTWASGKRPDSMTGMRVAAIIDLDATAKVDLDEAWGPDKEKPAPTFDAFVGSLYRATIRHASARKANVDGPPPPSFHEPKIDTSNVYGKPATN